MADPRTWILNRIVDMFLSHRERIGTWILCVLCIVYLLKMTAEAITIDLSAREMCEDLPDSQKFFL